MWKLALLIALWVLSWGKSLASTGLKMDNLPDTLAVGTATADRNLPVTADSIQKPLVAIRETKSSFSPYVLPVGLISYGVVRQFTPSLKRFDDYTRAGVQSRVKKGTRIDDYLQYAPTAAVFGLDWLGVPAKHDLKGRSLVLATSSLLAIAIVRGTKSSFRCVRPDGSNYKTFPSGHTATAFIGAHMLYKEYGEDYPWLAVAGYGLATTTGALRVVNNKHWVSDVVAGAGVGILSVELAYRLLPTIDQWVSKATIDGLHVQPVQYQQGGGGLALSYRF